MSFLAISARKDLQRRLRDPVSMVLWVGIPALIAGILSLVFGGETGGQPRGRLLVIDQDESLVSGFLPNAFGQGAMAEMWTVEQVEEELGRAEIEAGKASALLIIPQGFGQAILTREASELELVTNPAQRILPGIAEEMLSVATEAVFYLQLLFGDQLAMFAEGPPEGEHTFSDLQMVDFSRTINAFAGRLATYLNPPLIELETAVIAEEAEPFNFGLAFFPGMLFLALFFMAQGMSEDIWKERQSQTLRRIATTPASLATFLGGKLVAGFVLFLVVALVGFLLGSWLLGVAIHNLALAVAWSALAGCGLYLLMLAVQLLAKNAKAGSTLTTAVMFPLVMAGGSFFPLEAMPSFIAEFGRRTPNGWALVQLKTILEDRFEVGSLLIAFAVLLIGGLLLFQACLWRVRTGFLTS